MGENASEYGVTFTGIVGGLRSETLSRVVESHTPTSTPCVKLAAMNLPHGDQTVLRTSTVVPRVAADESHEAGIPVTTLNPGE